jgi:hypothetical protein
VERRTFLAAASLSSLASPLTRLAKAQSDISFQKAQIDVAGNKIFCRRYGQGPPILMVHGFPRTSLMWRFLAPRLAGDHTVICVDLRAYGQSGIPASTDDHFPYSKRAMAKELVEVMVKLGFPTFTLSTIFSDTVLSGRRFSKNMFPPIATLPAFMVFVRSIEPRQPSTWNMIAPTKRLPSVSNARCCIYGRRVVRSTLSMQKTAVRWASGVNGLRARKGRR